MWVWLDPGPESRGGQLVDLQTGEQILPLYNQLVLFTVPRMHCVVYHDLVDASVVIVVLVADACYRETYKAQHFWVVADSM